jgi:hypothetical protein
MNISDFSGFFFRFGAVSLLGAAGTASALCVLLSVVLTAMRKGIPATLFFIAGLATGFLFLILLFLTFNGSAVV